MGLPSPLYPLPRLRTFPLQRRSPFPFARNLHGEIHLWLGRTTTVPGAVRQTRHTKCRLDPLKGMKAQHVFPTMIQTSIHNAVSRVRCAKFLCSLGARGIDWLGAGRDICPSTMFSHGSANLSRDAETTNKHGTHVDCGGGGLIGAKGVDEGRFADDLGLPCVFFFVWLFLFFPYGGYSRWWLRSPLRLIKDVVTTGGKGGAVNQRMRGNRWHNFA